ncbi:ATP-dependent DNA ligase [Pedococcus sp. 2YAF34]|uniref:ATP-dependent DNA ligase n=1 Tax=Pedococcus sp. 2YAF34 TaxID=3233032 RepID=UPI003F96097C
MVNPGKKARALAAQNPASYMVFDLLALDGEDVRSPTLAQPRELLESLAQGWTPPLQLTPTTNDVATAQRWSMDYRLAGVEGLVVKGRSQRYRPGRRECGKDRAADLRPGRIARRCPRTGLGRRPVARRGLLQSIRRITRQGQILDGFARRLVRAPYDTWAARSRYDDGPCSASPQVRGHIVVVDVKGLEPMASRV